MGEKPKPFKVEYAKSGRAACRACKEKIEKDAFRIATVSEAPQFDGYMTSWFHPDCFMKRAGKIKSVDDVDGLDDLRWEDQKRIRDYAGPSRDAQADDGNDDGGDDGDGEFVIEYAKSSRSTCRSCDEKIMKDEVRIARMEESEDPRFRGKVPMWRHAKCFLETGWWKKPLKQLPGWNTLEGSERKQMEDLAAGRTAENPKKQVPEKEKKKPKRGKAAKADGDDEEEKPKAKRRGKKATEDDDEEVPQPKKRGRKTAKEQEEADGVAEEPKPKRARGAKKAANEEDKKEKAKPAGKMDPELEKALEKQSRAIWEIKDVLRKYVGLGELKEMLEANEQETKGSEQELRDRCADGMLFGPLGKCPVCANGHFEYHDGFYRCKGNLSEWSKCTNKTREAPRLQKKWVLPEDNDNENLEKWAKKQPDPAKRRQRVLPPAPAGSAASKPASKDKKPADRMEEEGGPSDNPLKGINFVILGKLSKPEDEVKEMIKKGGGKIDAWVTPETTCVLAANNAPLEEEKRKVSKARELHKPIVREDFLYDCVKDKKEVDMSNYYLEDTATAKVKVKGRGAVDKASGLHEKGHILERAKSVYNTTMTLSDMATGVNSFYLMQVIEEDKRSVCHLFRKWGRTGTSRGNSKIDQMPREEAITEFQRLFLEKTGNSWADWEARKVMKKPGKFYPTEIDYLDDAEGTAAAGTVQPGTLTKLDKRVVDLLTMLFNEKLYEAALKEFEINLSQMPLGKLKKSKINEGFSVLSEIQKLLDSGKPSNTLQHNLRDLSNRFNTLIPTVAPQTIGDLHTLKQKSSMLEALRDIEIASTLINDISGQIAGEDPVDTHYRQLKCQLQALPQDSFEYELACRYLQKTHAPTHTEWALEVEDVFELSRQGEAEAYAPFQEKLHNRMLLWHGSRTSNYVGILSQGLRIAPPEAPVTGYMFGKGLYFADMASKSAQYCYTSKGSPVGLMLISEVALGEMYEVRKAQYLEKPPRGKHSTKGCGKTVPNPKEFENLADGIVVPAGKPVKSGVRSSELMYNEYIVYDPAQVKLRFLLKVRFKHKH